jgi:signal peptidase
MRLKAATIARRCLTVAWLLVAASLIGLAALTHVAPTFVIQGRSMEPGIPFGSLIMDGPVARGMFKVGDVVTIRADNGVIISHRVTRTVVLRGERYYEIKGDANRTPDPVLVPARDVIGRVALHVPYLGYLVAMLGTSSGLISLLAMLAAGLVLIVLAEQLEAELSERKGTAGAAASEGSARGALA